ncbi:MAG: right-handed parallel beta-helix repeat-containing protein, partial [Candidatus Binatia bacterium]
MGTLKGDFFATRKGKLGSKCIMRASMLLGIGVVGCFVNSVAWGQAQLQELIDLAAAGSEVRVPKGTWKEPLEIRKAVKLRGEEGAECIIDVTSDSPAIRVETKGEVLLENLTIRWKRETSNRAASPQAAVVAKDTALKIQNVRFIAPDDKMRCPSAFTASGFSEVVVNQCEFEGFDFTIQVGGGARGTISDCVIVRPGHCGITVGNGGKLEVTGNIVTGSEFHAIRCTGGELIAKNNLIVANKNRGFYLGNRAARGEIKE